ncbi:MAG: fibro-slime domain-containing protein [Phycisphaerales bacterium]|nr:fibro-slime domain-containing protein [Phycisphaerales bacterium]
MKSRKSDTRAAQHAWAVAAFVVMALTAQAAADTVRIMGTVRDFRRGNSNFNFAPSAGNGHYAGNIAHALSAQNRPTFVGGGFKVNWEWLDQAAHPIAPHLYMNAVESRKVRLVNSPTIAAGTTVDTYDSLAGAYGPANQGPAPTFVTGSTIPAVTLPTGMPALVAEIVCDGAGLTTFNSDINCNKFLARNSHRVIFNGNRRLVCNEEFMIENFAKIELAPGATLTVWIQKDATIKNNIEFNLNTQDPSCLIIYSTSVNNFIIENSAATYFRFISATGGLHVKNSAQFFGSVTAKTLTVENTCGVHIDTFGATTMCGVDVNDLAGTAGAASNGGIVSAFRFGEWYSDLVGTNVSAQHPIELVDNGSGIYEFVSGEFFPIDDELFGNEGQAHNYYFTYAIETTFTHDACAGQFFEIEGADDIWVFIGGKLAIDLGGVLPPMGQYVAIDRLGLTDGQTYSLHLFYAQRNASSAFLEMSTNLPLAGVAQVGTITAGVD